jgi:hypothetical protein
MRVIKEMAIFVYSAKEKTGEELRFAILRRVCRAEMRRSFGNRFHEAFSSTTLPGPQKGSMTYLPTSFVIA